MLKRLISYDWFFKGDGDADYERVDLPHDYQVRRERIKDDYGKSDNGYYPTGCGTYVKHLELDTGKHLVLDIDGAYMNTRVVLNENTIAKHPYGFTPMLVDLTPFVIQGINKLRITTNPLPVSARWYTGNGIYRDVFLWDGGRARIEPWDLFITTEFVEDAAIVKLSATVSSDEDAEAVLDYTIEGKNGIAAKGKVETALKRGKNENTSTLTVKNALLWDTECPNLYEATVVISVDGEVTDTTRTSFGIRDIRASAEEGLLLNGKPIKLRGGCIHHDHGVLGAAAYPAAEERKVRLLKESGFNAIRTAHNPPSLAFLEACDRLGMIVMDEAFDTWQMPKVQNDYHIFFAEWCKRDISYMVLRERNHPSVFSYSIGNEIYEIDGTYGSAELSRMLADEIRKYDTTRFVTAGLQKDFLRRAKEGEDIDPEGYKEYLKERFMKREVREVNRITLGFEAPLDIVGHNYYRDRYELDHETAPDKVIWGSETRAIYFYDSWSKTERLPYVIGDFTWVAFDNMGEVGCGRTLWARDGVVRGLIHGAYPWRTCYQGDHELTGKRRPQSYFREAIWKKRVEPRIFVTHPEHFGEGFSGTSWHWYDVRECWRFADEYVGRPIKVETYSLADRIEWYINGRLVGESKPEGAIATLETVYEPGEITAVAYEGEAETARFTLRSHGEPEAIELTPEKSTLTADGRDLLYVRVRVTDGAGVTVDGYEGKLTATVNGGILMGIFSGDPKNEDNYGEDTCHAFGGEAVLVIKTKARGKIDIRVLAEGLSDGVASANGV